MRLPPSCSRCCGWTGVLSRPGTSPPTVARRSTSWQRQFHGADFPLEDAGPSLASVRDALDRLFHIASADEAGMLLLDWKPSMLRASQTATTSRRGPTTWWAWLGRRAARGFARGSQSALASLDGSWYGRRASAPASTSELGKRGHKARMLAGYGYRGTTVGEAQNPGPGVPACPGCRGCPWAGEWHPLYLWSETQGTWDHLPVWTVCDHTLSGVLRRGEPRGYRFDLRACCHGGGGGTCQIGRGFDGGWGSDRRGAHVRGASCEWVVIVEGL